MMSEGKILIKNLKNDNIDLNFKEKALEALSINNYNDLKKFAQKYSVDLVVDISKSIEDNKERLFYILNEEFYNLRDNNINLF